MTVEMESLWSTLTCNHQSQSQSKHLSLCQSLSTNKPSFRCLKRTEFLLFLVTLAVVKLLKFPSSFLSHVWLKTRTSRLFVLSREDLLRSISQNVLLKKSDKRLDKLLDITLECKEEKLLESQKYFS